MSIIWKVACVLALALASVMSANAQSKENQSFEKRVKIIADSIEYVKKTEKEWLKEEIKVIDRWVSNGTMSEEEAQQKKMALADKAAERINTKVAAWEAEIQQIVQDKVDGKLTEDDYVLDIRIPRNTDKIKKRTFGESRTTTQLVLAWGFNQAIEDGDVSNLDNGVFEGFGSRYFEWGVAWNTRLIKNKSLFRAKYGFSFMYNTLRPRNNMYFVQNGNLTELVEFDGQLRSNKFRNVHLVLPLHLELDFSKKRKTDQAEYIQSHRAMRIGLGGYAGINLKTRQILRYNENGVNIRERQRNDFNTSDFIYGLSGYIGYKDVSLYVKYDLNTVFRNQPTDLHNISMAIRFDFH
jgi:hypothetical protein